MDVEEEAEWFFQPPYGGEGAFPAKYSGRCFCMRVRFKVNADPLISKLCDDSVSQRLHGAPTRWMAIFEKSAVRFDIVSEPFLRFYNSAKDIVYIEGQRRVLPCKVQCTHCGTPVAEEGQDKFIAFPPTLFDFVNGRSKPEFPPSFRPVCHTFCNTQALDTCDGLPRFLDDYRTPASLADFLLDIAPRLDGHGYKGQAGRIGVLGGSVDFTGAPYYAGMASLRVGAELLYLCTASEATGPIKSYSPELMVSEIYRWSHMSSDKAEVRAEEQDRLVAKMEAVLPRLHALVIGPGLGRDDCVLGAVGRVINAARSLEVPLVIDADGLWLVEMHPELIQGYDKAVLTPNAAEYRRLAKKVAGDENADIRVVTSELLGPIVIQKGAVDRICGPGTGDVITCTEEGAPRRPGGLGDFLSGILAVLFAWTALKRQTPDVNDMLRMCQAACILVRKATLAAYAKKKRSMVAPDVLEEVGPIFEMMCPASPLFSSVAML